MIKLDIKDYCQTCKNFKVKVRADRMWSHDEIPTFHVGCEYEKFCDNINKHLAKKKEVAKENTVEKSCKNCARVDDPDYTYTCAYCTNYKEFHGTYLSWIPKETKGDETNERKTD